jgi:hypothetical protein
MLLLLQLKFLNKKSTRAQVRRILDQDQNEYNPLEESLRGVRDLEIQQQPQTEIKAILEVQADKMKSDLFRYL